MAALDLPRQGRAQIRVNGVLREWSARLVELTLTDYRGFEADALTITISDHDGRVNLPESGAEIELSLGFDSLWSKGGFIVSEIEYSDPPAQIVLRALSADIGGALKTQQRMAWHQLTLGTIIATIAARHNLTPAVADELAAITVAHIDQTDESDAQFLTRLGRDYGAIATVKNGFLLFIKRGASKTAGGLAITPETITRQQCGSVTYTAADRSGRYTGVVARWRDSEAAETIDVIAGSSGTLKTLRRLYPNEAAAAHAADAEWRRIQGQQASLRLTLAQGAPALVPETPILLAGFKPAIDARRWIIAELTHTLSGALTTELVLETAPAS